MDTQMVKVLVVEDDDADFMAIERAFQKEKILNEIVRAKDGVEALDLLRGTNGREQLRRPYVVLCDINMPRMDGLTLVNELRIDNELHDTLVFMLTTSNHDQDRRDAYGLNVAGYMLKNDVGLNFPQVAKMIGGFTQIIVFP